MKKRILSILLSVGLIFNCNVLSFSAETKESTVGTEENYTIELDWGFSLKNTNDIWNLSQKTFSDISINNAVLVNDSLYFFDQNGLNVCIDDKTENINSDVGFNICYNDDHIYYITDSGVCKVNIYTKEKTQVYIGDYNFIAFDEDGNLYSCDDSNLFVNGNSILHSNEKLYSFYPHKEYSVIETTVNNRRNIYLLKNKDLAVLRIATNTINYTIKDNELIFNEENKFYTVDLDTLEITPNSDIQLYTSSTMERAIGWAWDIANDDTHGYSQSNRQGPDYDCSSFVAGALKAAGFDVSYFTTANMGQELINNGFTEYAFTSQSQLERGDILWYRYGTHGHTEIYLGNNQLIGAHDNWDGRTGDSSGREICADSFYNESSTPWMKFYRYEEDDFNIDGYLDSVSAGSGYVVINGWTYDKDIISKALNIHVYIGGPAGSVDGNPINYADKYRPDVGNHGFDGTVIATNKSGKQPVYVYAIDAQDSSNSFLLNNCPMYVDIPAHHEPIGSFDGIEASYGQVRVTGWTFDEDDPSKQLDFHVYIGAGPGQEGAEGHQYDINGNKLVANTNRNDVDEAYGCGGYHGFDSTVSTDKVGTQTVYIYAINDGEGDNPCIGEKTVNIPKDTTKPVISNVKVTHSTTGYTVSCTVTDNAGVDRVQFPTWTQAGGQDDIIADWETNTKARGTKSGNTYTYTVKASDHNSETGKYNTHIYAYDKAGNAAMVEMNNIEYNEYTINYNLNGGSPSIASQIKYTDVNHNLSSVTPTKTGYTFKGWGISANAVSAVYQPSQTYTQNAGITLYAVWEAYKYTVSYNANGGSGAPSNQIKTYGQNLTVSSVIPTRPGYTFKGWGTSTNAVSAVYQPSQTYTQNAGITLYAVWEAYKYTVSYNANGGSGAPSNQIKTYGQNLTVSSVIPTRPGYTFKGWGTSTNAVSATYQPGQTYTQNADITLYALWEIIATTESTTFKESTTESTTEATTKITATETATEGTTTENKENTRGILSVSAPSSGCVGENFVVSINLAEAEKMAGGEFVLEYDPEKTELISSQRGERFTYNNIQPTVNEKYDTNKVYLTFSDTSDMDMNGTLLELTFKALKTGNAQFKLLNAGFTDHNLRDLNVKALGTTTVLTDVLLGDVNGDKNINYKDSILILRSSAKTYMLTNTQATAADVNKDGVVNYKDSILVLRYAAGTLSSF